jgi:hypothetical protein
MNEGEHDKVRRLAWSRRDTLILALLIAFPSTGFVQKYTGLTGVAAYLVIAIGLVILTSIVADRFAPWINRHFGILATLAIACLACGYIVLHPFEDNRGPGKSSDRDEGLDMAVTRLVAGTTPYYPSNQTAGPLSVLPGSMILAAPFVAIRDSGYQNVFWLGALLLVAARRFKDGSLALWLVLVPLALSPAAQYEFVSGGDLLANGIFVALFFLYALDSWSAPATSKWHRWLACLVLGIGIASRANFILLLPLFSAAMWRIAGLKPALIATALVVFTASAITLPIYLHDPGGFTPLLTKQKLAIVDHSIPWASKALLGTTILAALCGAFMILRRRGDDTIRSFFQWCTLVTMTPMIGAVMFSSMVAGSPDFGFMRDRFGLMYVFFAILGWGGRYFPVVPQGAPEGGVKPMKVRRHPDDRVEPTTDRISVALSARNERAPFVPPVINAQSS